MKTPQLVVMAMMFVAGCDSVRRGGDASTVPGITNGAQLHSHVGKLIRLDGSFARRPKGGLGIVPDGIPQEYVYLEGNPTFDAMNTYGLSSNLDLDGKRISIFGRLEWDPPITSHGVTYPAASPTADPSTYEDPAMYDVTSADLDSLADLSDQFGERALPRLPPLGLNSWPIGLPLWSQTGRYVMRDFWWRELPVE